MKKLMMIAVMAVAALTASAQQEVGSFSIAPTVGATFTNYRGVNNADPKFGFIGGANLTYQVTNPFAVTAGVFYNMCGAKASDTDIKLNTSYISVPVLANFYVAKGFALKIGLQPSVLLSAKSDGKDCKDGANSFDLSMPIGLSYEFSNIILDLRYNFGITKFNKNDGKLANKDDSMYNNGFMLTVGYKIGL